MIELSVHFDPAQIARTEELLKGIPGAAKVALSRAANRTIEGARTQVSRSITADYFIKVGEIHKTMKIRRATRDNLVASLRSEGPAISLEHFLISPRTFSPKRPPIGVRVRVLRSGKGEPIAGSFLIPGKPGVWRRKGAGRFPIQKLHGPAVPSMMKEVIDRERLEAVIQDRFERELKSQVDFILTGGK